MRKLKIHFLTALFMLLTPVAAQAGVVEIRPTTLTITPSQHIAVLSLVNPDARAAVYQISIYRWRQKGEEQILEPTDDVIASPPMVSLGDHGKQIVRIGLRGADLPPEETTYRLILQEVIGADTASRQGLNIALRLSIPLFVRSETDPPPDRLTADMHVSGNKATVTVRNIGAYAARITQAVLALPGADKSDQPASTRLAYILPGAWTTYIFTLPAAASSFHRATVTLQTNSGPVDVEAPVVTETTADAPTPMAR